MWVFSCFGEREVCSSQTQERARSLQKSGRSSEGKPWAMETAIRPWPLSLRMKGGCAGGQKWGKRGSKKRGRKKQWCSGIKVKSQQKNSSGNMFLCDLETCEQHCFVLIMFRFMFRCYLTPIFLISMFAVALFKLSHSMSHIHFFLCHSRHLYHIVYIV